MVKKNFIFSVLTKNQCALNRVLNSYPETLNTDIYDEVITIESEEAFAESRAFAVNEGILVGMSSGAALKAAVILAKRPENKGKVIVALLPDSGDRYLSTALYGRDTGNRRRK